MFVSSSRGFRHTFRLIVLIIQGFPVVLMHLRYSAGADVSEADRAGCRGAKRGGKEVRCLMLCDDADSKSDAFLYRPTFSVVSDGSLSHGILLFLAVLH